MLTKFPREMGTPKRFVVNNLQEYLKMINMFNGRKSSLFESVYSCAIINNKPNYDNSEIDKIFFDFDGEDSWKEANKLHEYLVKEGIKHRINFSGGGYHIYIITKPYTSLNTRSCIYNTQKYFIDKLKLGCDKQVIGDVSRLCRIPNTYNGRRKRFCIPLTQKDFESENEFVKQLSVKQHFTKNVFIGEKLLDIKEFDYKSDKEYLLERIDLSDSKSSGSMAVRVLPFCIANLLKEQNLNYKERYLVILYFKEIGFSKKEILQVLKEHLSEKKFKHCILEEKQLQYLWDRDDLIFPNCEKIEKDGYCVKGCTMKRNNNIYK